ncbi:UDP-D-xylose:L-fucose alpha-1,3-D-xylosyltransferase MGP4-like [Patiria miniata]|uniref:Nucleotide-diphospho-sugar transferase domain-containing protein n=1 Tax=Patiria miniata TaxID=46514 RepID=A0A914BCA7_PATMI|nr:UDP-D-xylose:L-fucose alpha-1,3-D-xylosyltransferase MGP4-like [Patiria miniata]
MDFTVNLLMSIERTGARPDVVVVAEDEQSFKELSLHPHPGLQVVKPHNISGVNIDSKNAHYLKFGTGDYNKFVNRRPKYILEFVQRGYEVFFLDADTFWFRDPFPYLEGNFDIAYYNDRFDMYNMGVAFYRPTNRTLRFLKHFALTLETQKKVIPDQNVMNTIIRSQYIPDLRIKHLNNENFPNGGFFFPFFPNMTKCREDTSTTVVFHAAWISGHKNKKKAFQTCHMWLTS